MLPLERAIRRIERRWCRDAALHRLWDLGPATAYAGLLAYAKARQWKNGWAYYSFVEIFGAKPRPQDRNVEPQANPLIDEWVSMRRKSPAKGRAA